MNSTFTAPTGIRWTPAAIRKLRHSLDMTQKSFAEAVGVERQATISKWERGAHTVSPLAIVALDKLAADLSPDTRDLKMRLTSLAESWLHRHAQTEENDNLLYCRSELLRELQ